MMAVDEMYGDLPMMERDRYWNDSNPRPPYTAATLFVLRKPSFQGSTFDMAIPKEEMHFQPLEDIAENLEESGTRHPNMALFNRLLNAAPSPTIFMGGALRRTSAQLQRLYHSPSTDRCTSNDEEDDEERSCQIGKGGSLPSGLGQDTQSTVCSFREERSTRTPLVDVQFGEEQESRGGNFSTSENREVKVIQRDGEGAKAEPEETSRAPVSLPSPPTQSCREISTLPASAVPVTSRQLSAFLFPQTAQSSLEHCSSQPAISPPRAMLSIPKPPSTGNKMSLLTVPSYIEPQRFRSVSMGSEFTGS
ncbi:hypothetical protein XENORESO_000146 [Xenotaenia resolanae]|uniref:Uncharacterized protein n=1 Tax=Xenotaenia resolanae TaxID=208358 RepID=A0ABV0W2N5_9TELE